MTLPFFMKVLLPPAVTSGSLWLLPKMKMSVGREIKKIIKSRYVRELIILRYETNVCSPAAAPRISMTLPVFSLDLMALVVPKLLPPPPIEISPLPLLPLLFMIKFPVEPLVRSGNRCLLADDILVVWPSTILEDLD